MSLSIPQVSRTGVAFAVIFCPLDSTNLLQGEIRLKTRILRHDFHDRDLTLADAHGERVSRQA